MERLVVLSLINNPSELILLYKGMPKPKKAPKYDIMLTPQFYIMKEEELPIKYAFQAKKLAASLLDDFLDSNKEYEFVVQKLEDNKWRFFAYVPKDIEAFLAKFGIEPHQINKIYFSDQIANILAKVPLSLDETNALVLLDSKATIIPKSMLESAIFADFNAKMRPKIGFRFKATKQKREESPFDATTVTVAVLLVLIGVAFLVQALSYKKAIKTQQEQLLALYEEAPSLQSKLTRKAIKSKYEKIEKRQRSIREQLKNFSQLSSKKSILEELKLNPTNIEAQFKVDASELKKVKVITANTSLSYKDLGGGVLKIQGALQ